MCFFIKLYILSIIFASLAILIIIYIFYDIIVMLITFLRELIVLLCLPIIFLITLVSAQLLSYALAFIILYILFVLFNIYIYIKFNGIHILELKSIFHMGLIIYLSSSCASIIVIIALLFKYLNHIQYTTDVNKDQPILIKSNGEEPIILN